MQVAAQQQQQQAGAEQQQAASVAARTTPESAQSAEVTLAVPPKPAADLSINMLGPVEIFRDPARPLAADAWTTKRARDILCFIA